MTTEGLARTPYSLGRIGSTHVHAFLRTYIQGEVLDFSLEGFQLRNGFVHFENGDGFTVHKHATGVTLRFFFETLDMKIDRDGIRLPSGNRYNINENEEFHVFVNGIELHGDDDYEIQSLDQILVTFGDESNAILQERLILLARDALSAEAEIKS
tara:strand:+ start:985 stop:1449 length:465 start_codon:yes stop_codon:yes gene_type:complete